MKTLILYKSKYGATEEYSQYLHSKIEGSEITRFDKFDIKKVDQYEYIIIGSPTYAGQVEANTYLINNWEYLKNKKIFVFTVGMADPEEESSLAAYNAIPEDIRMKIEYKKLPGRIKFQRLNLLEKLILKMMKAKDEDKVDMSSTEPILKFVKLKI
jgi:menaquinone-dependent protoporphyrinogen IX oxidase